MASNEATKKMDLGRNASRSTPPARGGGSTPTPPARPAQKRVGPFEFLQQVRDEGRKVTWPTRKETLVTTLMVFVMVVVASAFFLIADFVLQKAVGLILGIGG